MIWNRKSLQKYLLSKQRSVHVDEYLLLIEFINKIRPETLIDIGTYLGDSGYILGTCCDSIKNIISIENIDSPEYYHKPEATKEEHGKYLPKGAIFLTKGYEKGILDELIKQHPNAFVFWDAGKNSLKVIKQLELSHKNKIKYIAFHDSSEIQNSVRKAIKRAQRLGWYKIILEDINSCPEKGISILELIE